MIDLDLYDYRLSSNLIAKEPANPRDTSRLFVYNTRTDEVHFDIFRNLSNYLPEKSFLVLNNTKVIPSRIVIHKQNGAKVKVLFLVNENVIPDPDREYDSPFPSQGKRGNDIRGFCDRKVIIGDKLFFDKDHFIEVISQNEHIFTMKMNFSRQVLIGLLEKNGTMPIPLYIKDSPLSEVQLRERYQTIFAEKEGSSAAPTASLHFTDAVFKSLERKGISREFVTLHVGMGTFAPIDEGNFKSGKLHEEYVEIPQKVAVNIEKYKKEGRQLVAVGTTVTRSLESYAKRHSRFNRESDSRFPFQDKHGNDNQFQTNLFIYPPYGFRMVDIMITNFHLPKTSLMLLVDAFLKHKKSKKSLIDLYAIAIKEKFRFYSFGDSMLIL